MNAITSSIRPIRRSGIRRVVLFLALAGLTAVFTVRLSADSTVAFDDFESGAFSGGYGWIGDWVTQGDVAVRTQEGPQQGSRHARLRHEGLLTRQVNVAGQSNMQFQFWAKVKGFDPGDVAYAVASQDGVNITVLHTWTDADSDDTYRFYEFDLEDFGVTPSATIWVGFYVELNQGNDRFFVDEIEVRSLDSATSPPTPPSGDGEPIALDGSFNDWQDRAFLLDPWNDHSNGFDKDLAAFYWANNIDQEMNFHMVQRHTTDGQPFDGTNGVSSTGNYILYVDTNNNGNYSDPQDRVVLLEYSPRNHDSRVRARVYRLARAGSDDMVLVGDSGWNDWGETIGEGGLRFEFALTWDDLGLSFGNVIRMYLVSIDGNVGNPHVRDRLPDGNADIQWSPASILGPLLLTGAFAAGVFVIWWFRGRYMWTRRPTGLTAFDAERPGR